MDDGQVTYKPLDDGLFLFFSFFFLYFSFSQHSHSHFDLGVHVPLGLSNWGYRSLFEGTHILGVHIFWGN